MEAKTNYTIVGLIVLILIGGLISAGSWLSVGFNQKDYSFYTVYLSESASGLNEESPVKYNGVQVGFVKKIELNKNDPRQVEITLSVEEGIPVTTSTTATLISQGITGVTYIGLAATSSNLTPLKVMPGEPYPVIPARPSLFNQLDTILKEVSETVNKVSNQTQRIFNEENAKHISESLANLEKFSAVIANNSSKINNSLDSADLFLANMVKVSKDFPKVIAELRLSVNSISSTMDSGKRTVDKMSQQILPAAMTLMHKLNAIAANLESVSNEMRQNPSVVIRGTTPPKPGPGE